MGYTHYWNVPRNLTNDEFRLVGEDIKAIIEASGVPIAGWNGEGTPEYGRVDGGYGARVAFNGAGEEHHETFVITPTDRGFQFCKTSGDRYDVVVTASLLAFRDRVPGVRLSSDGEPSDWVDGHRLAERALSRPIAPFTGDEDE